MCGIVGIISREPFSVKDKLLAALKRLEYRGYDSVGYATKEGLLEKDVGYITSFIEKTNPSVKTTVAIAHTRWATHGGVTKANAHPHTNTDGTIFAIHNGIIENFQDMKRVLEESGYIFKTQTDTEIIVHYVDYYLKKKWSMPEIITQFMKEAEGTFAILIIKKDDDAIYALKRDSPLALGIAKDKYILASDLYACADETKQAIFLEDDEFAVVTKEGYQCYNSKGKKVKKQPTNFIWQQEEATKEEFPHYMLKEIKEQPIVAKRLIDSFATTQKERLRKIISLIKQSSQVIFIASGTSYHASLIGAIILNKLGYNARTIIASEVETFVQFTKDTLCIAISQSGETMDVLIPLKAAKATGAKIVSIVNTPLSTIQRMSDVSIECLAGQEICVAATKTFTNQVIILLKIAQELGAAIDLAEVPKKIQQTLALNEGHVKTLARDLSDKRHLFVLGRGMSYPMAREIALKLKEIPYIHAEGMMAGELKHGTIALIEKNTPVVALIPNGNLEMLSSTREVEARGAAIIAITNKSVPGNYFEFRVPASSDAEFSIYACIIGHLLSYYLAVIRCCEIDKPRNLAKCVTVK